MSTWAWLLLLYVAYLVGFGVGKYEKQIAAWVRRMES